MIISLKENKRRSIVNDANFKPKRDAKMNLRITQNGELSQSQSKEKGLARKRAPCAHGKMIGLMRAGAQVHLIETRRIKDYLFFATGVALTMLVFSFTSWSAKMAYKSVALPLSGGVEVKCRTPFSLPLWKRHWWGCQRLRCSLPERATRNACQWDEEGKKIGRVYKFLSI